MVDDYWHFYEGRFVYKVGVIAEKYGISPREIRSAVSSAYAYIDFDICAGCSDKNEEAVETRWRASQIIDNVYYHHFCGTCREKAKVYCKNMSEEDRKIVWMKLSFKYKLWTRLDKDEINFLKALYYLRSWNRIYHEIIKLDLNNHFKLLFKLDKMHLIHYDKNEVTGQIRIKMLKGLKELIQEKHI
ncbi:hypothetical protein [Flavobacterium sp.]|uniref:hypothetical protein n=1 Tax=Flavobacterium sp. TaxID=239 RepID=UPI002612B50E|nr:hypothetical protein [Flavobacterium sp.]